MLIHVDQTGTAMGLQDIIAETLRDERVKSLMILSCDENGFSPASVDPVLKGVPAPVFGGIFPAVIHGCHKSDLCSRMGLLFRSW